MLSSRPGLASLPWFQAVLAGMASPAVIALVLALTTLLLEDLAIAAGVALATQGAISWEPVARGGRPAASHWATWACTPLGSGRHARCRGCGGATWATSPRGRAARSTRAWASAVLLARVIPGLRLATYTACGFVRVPLLPFTAWVLLAVSLWTLGLYALSAAVGQALARHLGLPAPVAVALPILVLAAGRAAGARWLAADSQRPST